MKAVVATGVSAFLCTAASAADILLWDTGAPHQVSVNGSDSYLGLVSGNVGVSQPQRWAAIPFRIATGGTGAVIHQIDVDWFFLPQFAADNVRYIIWNRTGLAAPLDGDQFASGLLGAFGTGIDDPRTPIADDWLHQYAVNIPIPNGDYYFTMYGDGGTPPIDAAWLTGGDLQDEALEQNFMWRSESFPTPGFAQYAPGSVQAGTGMTDPDDRWNLSFALRGTAVPEPGTLALLGLGLAGLSATRRRPRQGFNTEEECK